MRSLKVHSSTAFHGSVHVPSWLTDVARIYGHLRYNHMWDF